MNNFLLRLKSPVIDLARNKVRTVLTSLGILIGVFAVIIVLAFGQGLKNYIVGEFENIGANAIFVFPGDPLGGTSQAGGGLLGTIKFDDKDLNKLEKIELAKYIVPVYIKRSVAKARGEEKISDLYGTTPDIFALRDLEAMHGRLFTQADISKRAKIAVIGPKLARDLFVNESSAVGKAVKIQDQRFTVVGVVEESGRGASLGGVDYDSYTYVPRTATTAFNPKEEILSFYAVPRSEKDIPALKVELEKILLKRYEEDEFSVITQKEILAVFDAIFVAVNALLIAIGSISLLVGGIGIMNIMYASVNDRIKEIGIRRALGATKGDILYLFLYQSVILALLGGFLGLGLAALVVIVIQPWFPAAINLTSVIVALFVSSGIGIFFGVFPANRAAKRSPIEAIRYE